MVFWLIAGALTIAAVSAVLVPLTRRQPDSAPGGSDLEVYKDQYAEVDRDVARGSLTVAEADEAKLEISRRILKAGDTRKVAGLDGRAARLIASAAVLSVPLVAWSVYAATGSPDIPSQPLQARLESNPANASVEELVARAEAHLSANPGDGKGWDVIAPIYVRLERYDDAVAAYRKAIDLQGSTAARQAGLGEALIGISGGAVGDEARLAFEQALAQEPDDPKAAFYLATGDAQQGRLRQAAERWAKVATALPADSPWRIAAERALEQVNAQIAAAEPGSGPAQADIDAAAQLSATERSAMIDGMVAQLDARLRDNPDDLDGWRQLIRSYVVLGRAEDAKAALGRGISVLEQDKASELIALAEKLGIAGVNQP